MPEPSVKVLTMTITRTCRTRTTSTTTVIIVVALATLLLAPQPAGADSSTRTAPFDGTFLAEPPSHRSEVPVCEADPSSGSVAGKVLAHTRVESGPVPQGSCITGMTVTDIRVPGSRSGRPVAVTADFQIESAVADVPAGQTETGANSLITPCVQIVTEDGVGGTDFDTCNYWLDPNNAAYTPLFGPQPLCVSFVACTERPTASRDEATDETWTWGRKTTLSQGTYQVRAYLFVYASNNDQFVGPVTAEVRGAVSSITVDIGAPS